MSVKDVLIYQTNNLAAITINSIKKNMPDWNYTVVKLEGPIVRTALKICNKPTLVVESGVVLNIQDGDIPPLDKLNNYHMAISREYVFADHDRLCGSYQVLYGKVPNGGIIDLSVFIINPSKWETIPDKDSGFWQDIKTIKIPRYMNHSTDVLIKEAVSAKDCFDYSVLGEAASIYNYIKCFEAGQVNSSEKIAYCLEKYLDYLDNVSDNVYNKIHKIANIPDRVIRFRKELSKVGD